MNICLCNFHPAPHHRKALQAFRKGLERHGINPIEAKFPPENCDLAVFWSHNPKHIIRHQGIFGGDYLVMERGYIGDRMEWTSLGFNGLNGRAEFHAEGSPPNRWEKHFGDEWLQPWKDGGDYILLIGQVSGDASVKHSNHFGWLQWMAGQLQKAYPKTPIRFRPHPINVKRRAIQKVEGTELSSTSSLKEDLAGASLAVTFNSNTGVDAVLAGVPTLAFDQGSMVYNIATHEPGELIRPDRMQWAHNMAYCQWSWDEIANGDAWEHLKQKYGGKTWKH